MEQKKLPQKKILSPSERDAFAMQSLPSGVSVLDFEQVISFPLGTIIGHKEVAKEFSLIPDKLFPVAITGALTESGSIRVTIYRDTGDAREQWSYVVISPRENGVPYELIARWRGKPLDLYELLAAQKERHMVAEACERHG